jgi:PERQ amino acid-rich with GYF domain-containing protein
MDGRHFAEEYVRRKKLADKGVAEKQPAPTAEPKASSSAGGWSEVAKKTGTPAPAVKEESVQAAGFKVVPSRKKGKK